MKIAIASMGRFHVLNLARELDALGEDVRFYSYVTRRGALRRALLPRTRQPAHRRAAPHP